MWETWPASAEIKPLNKTFYFIQRWILCCCCCHKQSQKNKTELKEIQSWIEERSRRKEKEEVVIDIVGTGSLHLTFWWVEKQTILTIFHWESMTSHTHTQPLFPPAPPQSFSDGGSDRDQTGVIKFFSPYWSCRTAFASTLLLPPCPLSGSSPIFSLLFCCRVR